MKLRILIGLGLIAALVGLFLLDLKVFPRPIATRLLIWGFALATLKEVLAMGGRKIECAPGLFLYGAIAIVAVVVPSLVTGAPVSAALLFLAAFLGAAIRFVGMAPLRSAPVAFPEAALLAAALLYTAGLLSFIDRIVVLRGAATGFIVLGISRSSDIFAYFVGSFIGRRKIVPAISPKKTWEGTIAGVLGAAGLGALFSAWLAGPPWFAAIIGALIGAASFLGDLAASGMKRWSGQKDSGSMLPEFGGTLDMADGILFAGPVAVICLFGA